MQFIPVLKEFLRTHGEIYTVRKYKMDARYVEVDGVGTCRRIPIGIVTNKKQLEPYVRLSGFSTLEDWCKTIARFIPNESDTKYLYHVVRIR